MMVMCIILSSAAKSEPRFWAAQRCGVAKLKCDTVTMVAQDGTMTVQHAGARPTQAAQLERGCNWLLCVGCKP